MIIFPAIDLIDGKAVRLVRGDYNQMTIYSEHPEKIALDFKAQGAEWIHIVDLEGAKDGTTPNFETVLKIKKGSGLKCEIGGGIRSMNTIDRYLENGIDRIILGTSAIEDEELLKSALAKYGGKVAVGMDIKDSKVMVKGWLEKSEMDAFDFCKKMEMLGVKTLIVTDISKDGAMKGTNRELYKELSDRFSIQIEASGGVSSMEDVIALRKMNLYGAIIGKAYYTKTISLKDAIEVSK